MNKFCWFVLGSAVGSIGTKLLIDHSDNIDIWFKEKLGIESPSKMLFNDDKTKEGIHDAFDKNDIGGDSNRTGSSHDRIRLSNIIRKEKYSESDNSNVETDSSESESEDSESIDLVVNDNCILPTDVENTKIYNNIVITKEPIRDDLTAYISITEVEYENAYKLGLNCLRFGYSPTKKMFYLAEHEALNNIDYISKRNFDNEEIQYTIDDMKSYIGDYFLSYVTSINYNSNSIIKWDGSPLYIKNSKDTVYIKIFSI